MASLDDLSLEDLKALKAGNLDGMSLQGLQSLKTLQPTAPAPAPSTWDSIKQGVGNLAAGAVRGAGSIGATLLSPIDYATDAVMGDRGPNVSGLVTGKQPISRNAERRQSMDDALQSMGAQPDSLLYNGSKIGAEVVGTLGVGGGAANVLARIPGVAAMAPNVLRALATAGSEGGNLLTRTAGAAANGGLSAGLIDPSQAGAGAALGGAMPGAMKLAGAAGNAIGSFIRGPGVAPDVQNAIKKAVDAGYVIPPTQANPSFVNRVLEGAAGKITTAQNASAQNAAVTTGKGAKDLGLAADTKITPDILKDIRKTAGQAYDAIGQTGVVTPTAGYSQALDAIAAPFQKAAAAFPNAKPSPVIDLVESLRSPSFDAAAAVEKVKQLRTAADDAFQTGNTDVGRAAKAGANALEDALDQHLQGIGATDALQQFRDARQLIAKTYTAEKALNPTTGTIDAAKLAAELKKGKPLSGGMLDAAEFAGRFPKAAQTPEKMGSLPQWSPLDLYGGAGIAGVGGALTGNPLAALGLTLPLVRMGARNAALSQTVQRGLSNPNNAILDLLNSMGDAAAPLIYRGAPAIAAGR